MLNQSQHLPVKKLTGLVVRRLRVYTIPHQYRGREGRGWRRPNQRDLMKHILLAKFKDGIPQDQLDQLINLYAKLIHLIQSMKAFHWGKDVSIENIHQGFTHVFESTFESVEGIAEYIAHPAHVEFASTLVPVLEKILVVDYKPTAVQL